MFFCCRIGETWSFDLASVRFPVYDNIHTLQWVWGCLISDPIFDHLLRHLAYCVFLGLVCCHNGVVSEEGNGNISTSINAPSLS